MQVITLPSVSAQNIQNVHISAHWNAFSPHGFMDGCSIHTGGHMSHVEMEDERVQPAEMWQGGSHFAVILGYFYECVVVY